MQRESLVPPTRTLTYLDTKLIKIRRGRNPDDKQRIERCSRLITTNLGTLLGWLFLTRSHPWRAIKPLPTRFTDTQRKIFTRWVWPTRNLAKERDKSFMEINSTTPLLTVISYQPLPSGRIPSTMSITETQMEHTMIESRPILGQTIANHPSSTSRTRKEPISSQLTVHGLTQTSTRKRTIEKEELTHSNSEQSS